MLEHQKLSGSVGTHIGDQRKSYGMLHEKGVLCKHGEPVFMFVSMSLFMQTKQGFWTPCKAWYFSLENIP